MTKDDGTDPALLNPVVLDKLRSELDDEAGVWVVFVRNFIAELPRRTDKLRLTLTTGDLPGSLDAVLSLKTSSQMVGAERLAGLALNLEQSLRKDTLHADPGTLLPRLATAHLPGIQKCGRQTIYLLQKYLHSSPST